MTLGEALDLAAVPLIVAGSVLALAASIGVARFPDVLARMHAATKPQVLGILLCLLGAAIRLRSSVDVWMFVLAGSFQLITAPVAAQLVGRLAYRSRHVHRERLLVDDLSEQ